MSQIKRLYRESWETFVGNAGVSTFWSNSDKTTLDYVSDKLGQTAVLLERKSDTTMQQLQEMLERNTRRILVKATGQSPVILQRIYYYEDKPFAGLFDPLFQGTPTRVG
jgi:type IV secretion system protein VirD4